MSDTQWTQAAVDRFNKLGELSDDLKIAIDGDSNMIAFQPGALDDGVLWLDKWQAKRLAEMLAQAGRAAGKP